MSSVETGQVSAVETGQMSAVGTRPMVLSPQQAGSREGVGRV